MPRMFRYLALLAFKIALIGGMETTSATADDFQSPDILVLGDSQLSFGSGPVFLDFFQNINHHCSDIDHANDHTIPMDDYRVGVIGVRSTSLHSWVARKGRAKDTICEVDPKWKANAATFGSINTSGNKFVQIGRGHEYQFCKPQKSAFEAMFDDSYYSPKLMIMSFLGNSAERWANNTKSAVRDVMATLDQLPKDLPCVFITSAPSYNSASVKLRTKAQTNLRNAFAQLGSQCSFVNGLTEHTIAANLGNRQHFRLNSSGRVKDPYHPNKRAARKFFDLQTKPLCHAISEQLSKHDSKLALIEAPR